MTAADSSGSDVIVGSGHTLRPAFGREVIELRLQGTDPSHRILHLQFHPGETLVQCGGLGNVAGGGPQFTGAQATSGGHAT
jgi:hypothetical protein